jgi:parallel beta-helix repeat protein
MNLKAYLISISLMTLMGCTMPSRLDISDIGAFHAALKKASPGDTVFISAGTFRNWEATIKVSGAENNPVVISGSNKAQTVFSDTITGNPFFRIKGEHIELTNIEFSNISFRIPIVVLDSCSNSSIRNCTFKNNSAMKQYNHMVSVSGNGSKNKIFDCTFDNIANGQLVSVRIGETYPVKTLIAQNLFINIPPNKFGNGAESVQVGQDAVNFGTSKSEVMVENNRFIRCNGEAEVISNKSSGNIYRNNRFENCKGAIVMRGGHECEIYGNEFQGGSIGIRLSGTRHHVHDNEINNTVVGIILLYGSGVEYEPAFYTAVSQCTIEDNIIFAPKECGIFIGDKKGVTRPINNTGKHAMLDPVLRHIYPPVNNKFISNTITAEKGKHFNIDDAPDNLFENNILN